MSNYTSGNKAPTQMAQMPNRVGNIDKMPAKKGGGVTNVTRPQGDTAYAPGRQGAPKASANPLAGRGQKVSVNRPKDNCGYNDSYRSSSYLR